MSINIEEKKPELRRLLFIGFGKVPGFSHVNWKDWKWPNAADYEAVFLNMSTLHELLMEWEKRKKESSETFSWEPVEQLKNNLLSLRRQAIDLIKSDRQIFALATSHFFIRFGGPGGLSAVSVYDWCPLPVKTYEEEGSITRDVVPEFAEYRQQIKIWSFYFVSESRLVPTSFVDDQAGSGANYHTITQPLFTNLSSQPLGISLRLVLVYPKTRNSGGRTIPTSGMISLLHYPAGGDLQEALRSLLRNFCGVDFVQSDKPKWLESIIPPGCTEIDNSIKDIDEQIKVLAQSKSELSEQRHRQEFWTKLLYETGDALEEVVFESLKLLGLTDVEYGPKGDHDIIADFDGKLLLFESKGLTKSAGRKEVFDLDRHIDEFENKNPGKAVSKGVLVTNAYRNEKPDSRGKSDRPIFAGDAVEHATILKFALLDTRDFYQMIIDKIETNNYDIHVVFSKLIETVGVYHYK